MCCCCCCCSCLYFKLLDVVLLHSLGVADSFTLTPQFNLLEYEQGWRMTQKAWPRHYFIIQFTLALWPKWICFKGIGMHAVIEVSALTDNVIWSLEGQVIWNRSVNYSPYLTTASVTNISWRFVIISSDFSDGFWLGISFEGLRGP